MGLKHRYEAFHRAMQTLYPDGSTLRLDKEGGKDRPFTFDDTLFDAAARRVYEEEKFTPDMLAEPEVMSVISETTRILAQAIDEGLPHETPRTVRHALENNAFVFSGFKTFHSMREIGLSLTTPDGDIKPFNDFLKDVERINRMYNHNYLWAEYNHAVGTSLMAARWQDLAQDGDRYNLQYRTAGDGRVREDHALLHGTTLPASDPFWDKYYPPNGWNCRCTVVQVRKDKHPTSDPALAMLRGDNCTAREKQKMFRFNPGKELKIMPDHNPYTLSRCKGCDIATGDNRRLARRTPPASELCKACRIIREQQHLQTARDTYRRLLEDEDYTDVQFDPKTGGVKATHKGHLHHDPTKERTYFDGLTGDDLERHCQDQLFRTGHTAILRDESQQINKGEYLPALDLELDGRVMDIRSITQDNPRGYGGQLKAKNKQLGLYNHKTGNTADAVCLYFHDAAMYSEEKILNGINYLKGFKKEDGTPISVRIKTIYCVVNGKDEIIQFEV